MLKAFVICHPQSINMLTRRTFQSDQVKGVRISCGTVKMKNVDLSEANDFAPTYASWNSILFETSVILTVWEHADVLIGDADVAFMHTDITPHFKPTEIWSRIDKCLREQSMRAIGLTVPSTYMGIWSNWLVPETADLTPSKDPMKLHAFDNCIHVWDFIKRYDEDIYDWAMAMQPRLIYSHQFACTRKAFDHLGSKLFAVIHRLRLHDTGFWTPHMFERLIALYLAKHGGTPVLTTSFWHHASSGVFGPGAFSLYGPRALKYYKTCTRWNVSKNKI